MSEKLIVLCATLTLILTGAYLTTGRADVISTNSRAGAITFYNPFDMQQSQAQFTVDEGSVKTLINCKEQGSVGCIGEPRCYPNC